MSGVASECTFSLFWQVAFGQKAGKLPSGSEPRSEKLGPLPFGFYEGLLSAGFAHISVYVISACRLPLIMLLSLLPFILWIYGVFLFFFV